MLRLKVSRQAFTPLSTQGSLLIQGLPFCHTLEPRKDQSQGKPFCIPIGSYKVELLPSHHFKTITPHILDVPGFTDIEIHWGNAPQDTEGCLLVGDTADKDWVGQSRTTFDALMRQIAAANDSEIEISYEEPVAA